MDWLTFALTIATTVPRAFWHAIWHPLATLGLADDARRLGLVRVVTQLETEGRIPTISKLLTTAEESINLLAYAPNMVTPYSKTLIDKANQGIRVTIILPDPRKAFLVGQMVAFTEGRSAFRGQLLSSLETLRACIERVADKNNLRVFISDAFPMFTALIVDRERATVALRSQGWLAQDRILIHLRKAHMLKMVLSSWDGIQNPPFAATQLQPQDFDEVIAAASAI